MTTTFPADGIQPPGLDKILWPTVFQSITDPVCILDQEFRLCWINHEVGYDTRIGGICYQVFRGSAGPCPNCPVRRVFATGTACVTEKWSHRGNGTPKCDEIRAYPVNNGDGGVGLVVKICHDITARKMVQERRLRYLESLAQGFSQLTPARGTCPAPASRPDLPVHLSPRELEVIRLVAQGCTNIEIAGLLAISPHTVKTHIINLCNKIGAADRTQAAVWAARHQLI